MIAKEKRANPLCCPLRVVLKVENDLTLLPFLCLYLFESVQRVMGKFVACGVPELELDALFACTFSTSDSGDTVGADPVNGAGAFEAQDLDNGEVDADVSFASLTSSLAGLRQISLPSAWCDGKWLEFYLDVPVESASSTNATLAFVAKNVYGAIYKDTGSLSSGELRCTFQSSIVKYQPPPSEPPRAVTPQAFRVCLRYAPIDESGLTFACYMCVTRACPQSVSTWTSPLWMQPYLAKYCGGHEAPSAPGAPLCEYSLVADDKPVTSLLLIACPSCCEIVEQVEFYDLLAEIAVPISPSPDSPLTKHRKRSLAFAHRLQLDGNDLAFFAERWSKWLFPAGTFGQCLLAVLFPIVDSHWLLYSLRRVALDIVADGKPRKDQSPLEKGSCAALYRMLLGCEILCAIASVYRLAREPYHRLFFPTIPLNRLAHMPTTLSYCSALHLMSKTCMYQLIGLFFKPFRIRHRTGTNAGDAWWPGDFEFWAIQHSYWQPLADGNMAFAREKDVLQRAMTIGRLRPLNQTVYLFPPCGLARFSGVTPERTPAYMTLQQRLWDWSESRAQVCEASVASGVHGADGTDDEEPEAKRRAP
jgi:hypothetical protein